MNIERAKEIKDRYFNGVRAGEFTKEELAQALKVVREWRYENEPAYRAQMDKCKAIGKALSKSRE